MQEYVLAAKYVPATNTKQARISVRLAYASGEFHSDERGFIINRDYSWADFRDQIIHTVGYPVTPLFADRGVCYFRYTSHQEHRNEETSRLQKSLKQVGNNA